MFLTELAEPTLLVIYPGRFQPFHKGHYAVYEYLTGKFGRNNVYIATSNKADNLKSPFTFSEKSYFMQLTGVPADRIVQATQPYQIQNVLQSGHITVANPANTVVIFAVSEKDMAEDPRFSFAPKKDGTPPYFQPLKDLKDTVSMDQHGYIMTVPTFDFTVLGQPMRSGTELRKMYADADEKQRQEIIAELFGKYTREAEQIMSKIVPSEPVKEPKLGNKVKLQKVKVPKEEPIAEAELPASELNKLYQFKRQLAQQHQNLPEPTAEPEQQSTPSTPPEADLSTLQQRKTKLDTIIALKKEIEALLPRAERVPGGLDRGTRADLEIDYPTPHTDKEYNEVLALYTKQIQQLKNFIARKRALYREGYYKDLDIRQQDRVAGEEEPVGDFRVVRNKDGQWVDIKQHYSSNMAFKHAQNIKQKYPSMEVGVRWPNGKINLVGHSVKEEAAGVGVVKGGKDPRYVMATTGDQNNVTAKTPMKNLRAFNLAEEDLAWVRNRLGEGAVDALAARHIEYIGQDIAELKKRITTEKLPANYVEALKQKIAKLEAERSRLAFNPK
jgi:hypothetical protein